MARKTFSTASRPCTTMSPSPPNTPSAKSSPSPAKSPASTSAAYVAIRFSMARALYSLSGTGTAVTVLLPSSGKVHELDTGPVRIGAVDEVEPVGAPERRPGGRHDGAPQHLDELRHPAEVRHPEREMGQAHLVHGAPDR